MNLKLSDWANIASIASGIVVIVTLVFLIIGIRENTAVVRASTFERSADRLIELRSQMVNDPELARMFQAYLDRRPEDIDGIDAVRFRQLIINQYQIYEQAYLARQYGLLGDAEWRRFERQICLQPGPPTPLRLHPKRRTCVSFVLRRSATPGSRADGGSRETPDARAPDRRPSSA